MPLAAQTHANDTEQTKAALADAAKQGYPLSTDLTVRGNVTVQAVLIPSHVARRVFGREIARNYAVIELIVNNKSPDAALIIQGLYIDYTDWAFSGSIRPDAVCTETTEKDDKSIYQACTRPNQVASAEYRVVRGEALDTEPFTARNLIVGMLGFGGSIASAYSFSLKERGIIKGISAFSGTVVPGLSALWPDQTVAQLNRISDVGYQTNKAIPKQGSDIIVGFFPIERFLTKTFKKYFLDSPAVFFAPFQMLFDPDAKSKLEDTLQPALAKIGSGGQPLDLDTVAGQLPCYLYTLTHPTPSSLTNEKCSESGVKKSDDDLLCYCMQNPVPPQVKLILKFIGRISLNTIRVVIDGVMTVETASLPAKIESVEFDNEKTNAMLWTDTSKPLTGTIKGSYLTSGVPQIQDADKLGVDSISAVSDGSTDQSLRFSLKLKSAIKDGTQITFMVEKTVKDASGAAKKVDSTPFIYTVHYPASNSPQIDSITFDGDQTNPALWTDTTAAVTGTITGKNLKDCTPAIAEATALEVTVKSDTAKSDDTRLAFSLQLKKAIPETKLTFTAVKTIKDANGKETTLPSKESVYEVKYATAPNPAPKQPPKKSPTAAKGKSSAGGNKP
jgi:hypothetical protein